MSHIGIDDLPEELIALILGDIKSISGPLALAPSLLCCKRWYKTALPLFYSDIVLTTRDVLSFTTRLPPSHRKFIRNLSIFLFSPVPSDKNLDYADLLLGAPETQELWLQLEEAATVLKDLIHLSTFSLRVLYRVNYASFWISRSSIEGILENLPESCVNLEIDTWNFDGCLRDHVCKSLAKAVPRLHHLRLNMKGICPDIFGTGFSSVGEISDESAFKPHYAPFLRTVIINSNLNPAHTRGRERNTRFAMEHALRELLRRDTYPALERLYTLGWNWPPKSPNKPVYTRYDILKGLRTPCATRHPQPEDFQYKTFLALTPRGFEVHRDLPTIATLAEHQAWKETSYGLRLPAELFHKADSQYIEKPLPVHPFPTDE